MMKAQRVREALYPRQDSGDFFFFFVVVAFPS